MIVYKIINKINGKYYIGKDSNNDPRYYGSGKLIKQAIKKYGKNNFDKIIIEHCINKEHLNEREKFWINESNALNDPKSYNLANGGAGGDLSKFIPYNKIDYSKNKMSGTKQWFNSLSKDEKKEWHKRQGEKRSKGWFVSKVDDSTEVYVQNIAKWCEEHGIDKAIPSSLNNPNSRLFQKQSKGWRIRRSDMPLLPPYENKRYKSTDNGCKGKTWKLVDGKRIWLNK